MLIECRKTRFTHRNHENWNVRPWKKSAPFILNPRGLLVHRAKAVGTLYEDGKPDHPVYSYWCGNVGNRLCELIHEPPEDRLVCARCEAVAIAAGEVTSDALTGRHVHLGGLRANRLCCTNESN